jgi:DNA-3-methyladenine glycosylase II
LKLKSLGTLTKPRLQATVFSEKRISDAEMQALGQVLQRALRTDEDLTEFYELARNDDVLRNAAEDLCGMRSVSWPELFPALILALTLQMAPLKRSNQMMDMLVENFGDEARFDGKTLLYWPAPARIAKTPILELRAKARLGYGASSLAAIARALEGFPTMEELYALEPGEARKKLLSLRGIGDYSADLVMLGSGFPLDIWSAKIFSVLFHGKKPEDPRKAIPVLKEMAEERWGKWRGYAFVYVLNDLPAISKRVGVDLTGF